jgi:hypothetical protein
VVLVVLYVTVTFNDFPAASVATVADWFVQTTLVPEQVRV